MSEKSMKTLREEAERLLRDKVTNREAFDEAVPVVIGLNSGIEHLERILRQCKDVRDRLTTVTGDYAETHAKSVFGAEHMAVSAKGVRSGDVQIGSSIYHLACGYGSPKRISGDPLTQEFLGGLPIDWVKTHMSLDTTGLNRLGIGAEELERFDLYRPAKSTWSLAVANVD